MSAQPRRTTAVVERPEAATKAVILATGDSRLASGVGPRAMVEIGGRPLLWHAMQRLAGVGIKDFVVALGAGGEPVRRYLLDACANHDADFADQTVDVVDVSGGLGRPTSCLGARTSLVVTCDVFADVDLAALLRLHRDGGCLATVVTVQPLGRFGELGLAGDRVVDFAEKPLVDANWTDGGVYALEPGAFEYTDSKDASLDDTLQRLALAGELAAYTHRSFYQRLESLRDKQLLEELWQSGNAPWLSRERKSEGS